MKGNEKIIFAVPPGELKGPTSQAIHEKLSLVFTDILAGRMMEWTKGDKKPFPGDPFSLVVEIQFNKETPDPTKGPGITEDLSNLPDELLDKLKKGTLIPLEFNLTPELLEKILSDEPGLGGVVPPRFCR